LKKEIQKFEETKEKMNLEFGQKKAELEELDKRIDSAKAKLQKASNPLTDHEREFLKTPNKGKR
jgi:chromosome segregation ATPase